jgi:MerC mercury resistance protein
VHSTGLCHLSVFVYNNLRADLIVPFRHCDAGYDTADFVPHHVRFSARLDSNPVSQMHSPWFLAFQLPNAYTYPGRLYSFLWEIRHLWGCRMNLTTTCWSHDLDLQ